LQTDISHIIIIRWEGPDAITKKEDAGNSYTDERGEMRREDKGEESVVSMTD
jgi:hypothetical protein